MGLFGNRGFAPQMRSPYDDPVNPMVGRNGVPAMGGLGPILDRIAKPYTDRIDAAAPAGPMQDAIMQAPKKRGLFGNAFRADSPLWKIMGGIGDVITGEPVYTSGLMQERDMRRRSLMEQAQREAEDRQWYGREKWKRDNPEPRVNDTVADYEFLKQRIGPEAADQYLRNMGDPMVTVPLGDGSFYNGPRSGLGGAIGGGHQAKPRKLGPVVDQIPGGPASAPGGFPR